MNIIVTRTLLCVVLCAALGACQTQRPPGPYLPREHAGDLERTESLVLLDSDLQLTLSIEDQEAGYTDDGRLTAAALIRNRSEFENPIQVQTVYKDYEGYSHGDESAWETIVLGPLSSATYRSTALNSKSERYTIRIRRQR